MTETDSEVNIRETTKQIRDADVKIKKLESTLSKIFDDEVKNMRLSAVRIKSVIATLLTIIPLYVITFAFGILASPWIYRFYAKKFMKREMLKNSTEFKKENENLSFLLKKKKDLEEQRRDLEEQRREKRKNVERAIEESNKAKEAADFIRKLRSCGLSEDQIHDIGGSYNYKFPFFGASEEALMEFQGIGKKKAKLLKQVGF
jgi:hypothetical protein